MTGATAWRDDAVVLERDAATLAHDAEAQKRAAGEAAAACVEDGMLLGLGTGSTVAHLLDALGERVAAGLAVRCVATSHATERRAAELGIAVEPFDTLARVDLAIDGVDEIDPAFRAIKGAGGAALREKVVAEAADRMIAIADTSKTVAVLGAAPVPVEVLGFARAFAAMRIERLGGEPIVRAGVTDQGNPLLDCRFGRIDDPERLAAALQAIPGVVGHGLFLDQIGALCVGTPDGPRWTYRRA